jgi:hypothetical protein
MWEEWSLASISVSERYYAPHNSYEYNRSEPLRERSEDVFFSPPVVLDAYSSKGRGKVGEEKV